LREEEHVSRRDAGSPTGILAESADRGERGDLLVVLDDEGVIAKLSQIATV
jgi:hypothetical protein